MRTLLSLFLLLPLLFFCDHSPESSLREMRQLEFQREIDQNKFISWLNSKNDIIRATAVETLGQIQDTSTVSWVANRLGDPSDSVRARAAFAMGQFFSRKAEEPLLAYLPHEKNDRVRRQMIEALGKTGTEASFTLMRSFLESGEEDFQSVSAIGCGILAYRGYPPHMFAGSLGLLLQETTNSEISWRGTYALFRMGSASEFSVLVQMLKSRDALTRYFALRAQKVILDYARSAASQRFRQTAPMINISRTVSSPEYQDRLVALLHDSTWYVQLATLQLVESLVPKSLWKEILTIYPASEPQVRIAALKTVARYNRAEGNALIKKVIHDGQDWRERGEALLLYTGIDPNQALQEIRNLVDQATWPKELFSPAGIGRDGTSG